MAAGSADIHSDMSYAFEQPYEDRGQRPGQLPPAVADFLDTLRMEANEANDVANAASASAREARQERVYILNHIADMERNPLVKSNDRSIVEARNRAAAEAERVKKLDERAALLNARWHPRGALLTRIDEWLSGRSGVMLEPFTGPAPKLARGEKPAAAIDRLRGRLAELRQEAGRIERAPIPAKEAKAAAREFVQMMAFGGKPDVQPLLRSEGKPDWPNLPTSYQHPIMGAGGVPLSSGGVIGDAITLTAWLHGPAMLKALEAQIDAEAKDDRAMPTAGRAERIAELQVEALAIEREEEALIRALAEDGVTVDRRPDASPEAVLQVRVA